MLTKFLKTITLVVIVLEISNQVQSEDYCLADDPNPYIYVGPITPYELVHGNITVEDENLKECSPIQFWSANRHGTRLPVGNQILVMEYNGPRLQKKIIKNYEVIMNDKLK